MNGWKLTCNQLTLSLIRDRYMTVSIYSSEDRFTLDSIIPVQTDVILLPEHKTDFIALVKCGEWRSGVQFAGCTEATCSHCRRQKYCSSCYRHNFDISRRLILE